MSEEKTNKHPVLKAFGVILLIAVILFVGYCVLKACISSDTGNSSGTTEGGTSGNSGNGLSFDDNKITYRDANNGDISGDWNDSLTEQKFVFIPKYDIVGLQFTFTVKNKKGETIKTVVKNIGNVTKGQQYTATLTLSDVGLGTVFSANTTYLNVTGGRVRLI